MGRVMQLASFSLAEVTYATGDISYLVQEQAKAATFRVKAKQENVSGVVLPAFEVDRVQGSGALPLPFLLRRIIFNSLDRLQSDRLGSRWSTGSACKGGLCQSSRDSCRTRISADRVHDTGRSYSRYKSTSKRYRACRDSSLGEHDKIHHE